MTIDEAIRILDPETSVDALTEINYCTGFDRSKSIEVVDEACVIACDVMREHLQDEESYKSSYENLNKMPKEQIIGLFLKIKGAFNKASDRCERLERENERLSSLEELIDSI